MTVDSVRRISSQPPAERVEELVYENFEFVFENEAEREILVSPQNYPFDQPYIIYGTFEYESEPLFGSPTESRGRFQIRQHSQLIISESENSVPNAKKVLEALAEAVSSQEDSGDFSPEEMAELRPKASSISDFINRADRLIEAEILDSRGDLVTIEDPSDGRLETNPIERLQLRFTKKVNGTEHSTTVVYSDDQIRIDDESCEIREYVLQHFESAFASE
ncbi:hypothetical protein [Halarchaeum sp. P4]|uniref:hypothetical protein n=1 Tax=Halarchaeum sp. P4 TaxID=3421639 RepID=UPI003EB9E70D